MTAVLDSWCRDALAELFGQDWHVKVDMCRIPAGQPAGGQWAPCDQISGATGGGGQTTGAVAGPRGGQEAGKPDRAARSKARLDRAHQLAEDVQVARDNGARVPPAKLLELANHLGTMTVKELTQFKRERGLKASGKVKEELKQRLLERLQGRGTPAGKAEAARQALGKATMLVNLIRNQKARGQTVAPGTLLALANHLDTMTVAQLTQLKKDQNLKASGKTRAELARRLHERLTAAGGGRPPAKPKREKPGRGGKKKDQGQSEQPVPPATHVDPDAPMSERLRAYTRGDAILANVLAVSKESRTARAEYERLDGEAGKLLADHQYRLAGDVARRYDRLRAEREKAYLKQRDEKAQVHAAIFKHVRDPVRLAATATGLNDYQTRVHDAGIAFVRQLLAHGPQGPLSGLAVRTQPVGPLEDDRDYHSAATGVHLSSATTAGVMVHEMGHWLEAHVPGANDAAQDFLKHRVGNEVPRKMTEVVPGSNYRDHEVGRKDRFDRTFQGDLNSAYYAGKDYGSYASEITSMGLQLLHDDPAGFAERDPEYFKFILGQLDGSLRKRA